MLTKEELPPCPVATTVRLIGNKWKLLILQQLLNDPCRFGELQKMIPGISQKVLTDNLRSMEEEGLIDRIAYPEIPPHVEYRLNKIGNNMRPIIKSMETWGKEYQQAVKGQ